MNKVKRNIIIAIMLIVLLLFTSCTLGSNGLVKSSEDIVKERIQNALNKGSNRIYVNGRETLKLFYNKPAHIHKVQATNVYEGSLIVRVSSLEDSKYDGSFTLGDMRFRIMDDTINFLFEESGINSYDVTHRGVFEYLKFLFLSQDENGINGEKRSFSMTATPQEKHSFYVYSKELDQYYKVYYNDTQKFGESIAFSIESVTPHEYRKHAQIIIE